MFFMPTDVYYHDCRIVWDTRQPPGKGFWKGMAAVVLPAEAAGVKTIHPIRDNEDFSTEEAARDHLINAAQAWIDENVKPNASCIGSWKDESDLTSTLERGA